MSNFDRWIRPVSQISPYVMPPGLVASNGSIPFNYQIPYPVNALPPLIQRAVAEVAHDEQAHPALVGTAALSTATLGCQGLIDVQLKPGLIEPTSLFFLVTAESGERKTRVSNLFLEPVRKFEAEQTALYQQAIDDYDEALDDWKDELKNIRAECRSVSKEEGTSESVRERKKEHRKRKPQPPRQAKLLYVDTTVAALLNGIRKWPSAGLVVNEAMGVLNSQLVKRFDLLNSFWDGQPIPVDRCASEYQLHGLLMFCLMAQPTVLADFLKKHGAEAHGTGWLARCLFAEIPTMQATRQTYVTETNRAGLFAFQERLTALLHENVSQPGSPKLERLCLKMDETAQQRWFQIIDEINGRCQHGGWLSAFPDYKAKLPTNIGRLAAVLSYFENGSAAISVEYVECAKNICYWHADGFVRYFSPEPKLSPHLTLANQLLAYLYRRSQLSALVQKCTREPGSYGVKVHHPPVY